MTERTVRDEILEDLARWLERHDRPADETETEARELEQILAGHGLHLPRTTLREQRDHDWAEASAGPTAGEYQQARAAMRRRHLLTKSSLTAFDFEVLRAAAHGKLFRLLEPGSAFEVWATTDGRLFTTAAAALAARDLLALGDEADGRAPAELTKAGRELLAEFGELALAAAGTDHDPKDQT